MVDFEKVRNDILGNRNATAATALAIAAFAEVIQEAVLMDGLDYDDRKILARKLFGISEPEQADSK